MATTSNKLPDVLTNAVLACISRQDYHVDPPKLSPGLWDQVCILTPEAKAENERLEFLGDALMDACFGMELYRQVPEGYPHMYTEIRSALHRNLAFCHLAHKMGVVQSSGHTKSIGDIFETLMGAYYTEKGFDALYEWTKRTYEPIIIAAVEAFYAFYRKQKTGVQNELHTSMSSLNLDDPWSSSAPSSPVRGKGKHRESDSGSRLAAGPSSPVHTRTTPTGPFNHTPPAQQSAPSPTSRRQHYSRGKYAKLFPEDEEESLFDYTDTEPPSPHPNLAANGATDSLETHDPPGYDFANNAAVNHPPPRPMDAIHTMASTGTGSDLLSGEISEEPLPEFWEEIHLPDGKIVYADHKNQTTTWEDPRKKTPRVEESYSSSDSTVPAAWTARLVAPVPVVAQSSTFASRWAEPAVTEPDARPSPPQTNVYSGATSLPFADLLHEGYILVPWDNALLPDDPLPDFWEVREAGDGYSYCINHATASIVRRPRTMF